RRWRWATAGGVAVLALGIAGWLYGASVYRFATNKGELVIETDDPDVEVTVKQNGEQGTGLDRKTGKKSTRRARHYPPELAPGKEGLALSAKEFTLERGGKQIVRVRLEPAAPKPPPVAEPEKPPFVVVAGTAKAEKPFATLAEAVAAAASGDAIE